LFVALLTARVPVDLTANARVVWPEIKDEFHVNNGCYLSASRFLARFLLANPGAEGSIQTVIIPGGDKHSIAVLKNEGKTWGRDEFIGVFNIHDDTQRAFDSALKRWFRKATEMEISLQTHERTPQSFDDRMAEVERAKALLPESQASEIMIIPTTRGQIAVLVWNPEPGRGAVYEPSFGTATADTKLTGKALARAALARVGFELA
jgi:hypothetical protein